jgi:hypothetical protein
MTKQQYKSATGIFSTQLALGSFSIGTVILIAHLLNPNGDVFAIGFFYLIFAAIVNTVMVVKLCNLFVTQKNHQDYFAVKILILLSNIPIAFVYLKIVGETWK